MRPPSSTLFAIPATLVLFAPVSFANWAPDRAAQINFYTNTQCSTYASEVAALWTQTPLVGVVEPGTNAVARAAQCFNLSMPANAQSINTVTLWAYATSTTTVPTPLSGNCTFWDDDGCGGNEDTSLYNPSTNLTCLSARSRDGGLWISARCWSIDNGEIPIVSNIASATFGASAIILSSETATSSSSSSGISSAPSNSTSPPIAASSSRKDISAGELWGIVGGLTGFLVGLAVAFAVLVYRRRGRERTLVSLTFRKAKARTAAMEGGSGSVEAHARLQAAQEQIDMLTNCLKAIEANTGTSYVEGSSESLPKYT
ncbi:hypothetical protein B0H19DRAFT_490712 [Mycena capillaripes]|nr:hypothetical protein B0H19DRAFT_490712 [Mycena capillaripes]